MRTPRLCPRFGNAPLLVILLFATLYANHGRSQETQGAQQWALLIGVTRHDDARLNLSFTDNDALSLQRILTQRAGVSSERILTMTERSDPAFQPTIQNLKREIPAFLSRVGPDDQVLFFFSGHGAAVGDQTYLVPRDFDASQAQGTGLAAGWLRQALTDCAARVKFLMLDCCHAGGAKSTSGRGLPAERVAKALIQQRVNGCLVLASCRADELSWVWPERKQSLFTYWLCRALEGGADKDGDSQLTADEVYEYTHERVSTTAARVFSSNQTPVRLIGGDVEGVPRVLTLRPEPPESLCRRLAEHLDVEIRYRDVKHVGVLEFLQPTGRIEGLAAANLPAYCADRVRNALARLAQSEYTVIEADTMREAAKDVPLDAIGDPDEMRVMRQKTGALNAVVSGTIRRRGTKVNVQCELIDADSGNGLATPAGAFPLSEDLLGDTGVSFDNRQRPAGSPYDEKVIRRIQAAQDHPLLQQDDPSTRVDESFPFPVEIWSIQARPGEEISSQTPRRKKDFIILPSARSADSDEVKRSQLTVAARENEIFEIRIWNKWPDRVGVTVLVDGINTYGQRRERLGQAQSWVLKPTATRDGKPYVIRGWYLPNPKNAGSSTSPFTVKRFKFVDMAESVAVRQRYGDSIGLITAAFYAQRGRALGVGEGPEEQRNLRTLDFQPGRLLGVINIRYVDEQEIGRLFEGG